MGSIVRVVKQKLQAKWKECNSVQENCHTLKTALSLRCPELRQS